MSYRYTKEAAIDRQQTALVIRHGTAGSANPVRAATLADLRERAQSAGMDDMVKDCADWDDTDQIDFLKDCLR